MTSFFQIIGHMAHGVGNIDVGGAVLKQVLKIFKVFARWRHSAKVLTGTVVLY